jgi:RNA polymerase sigma factor (sigma-70 family)
VTVPRDVRDQLILDHLWLVTFLAHGFRAKAIAARVERDDLIQSGTVGLILAAEGWSPHFGRSKFSTYARAWIRGYLSRAVGEDPGVTGFDLDDFETDGRRRPRPPTLVPLFPIGAYTPSATCAHRRPITPGSVLCCMVCHQSGVDAHPLLQRDPRTDPRPEQKPAPAPKPGAIETRRQRRARLHRGEVRSA